MATSSLKRIDGTLAVPLPEEALQGLLLEEGSTVEVSAGNDFILIRTGTPRIPALDLDQLLAEYDQMPQEMKDYREWVDAPRVGRELI